ncbi:MAG: carboxypeptidase regulatory-like domain-containing protein, partial [Deltaproteobacteria bacterium]|nr:carboxypeptidase regulatory-like domain-containing protein [Candidatus Desulfacyla euxinica]
MNCMIQRNALGVISLVIIFSAFLLNVSLTGCSSSSGTSSTGTIKGFVTDTKTGADLKGVLVSILNSSTETDSDGHYILTGISEGNWNVTASKTGYITYTGVVDVAGGQTTFLDIQITPGPVLDGEIRGSVIDNDTLSSIENAVISIGSATTTSNSDGSYHLSGIPSGVQIIKASKSGYQNYSGSVEVKAGKTVFHDISMIPEPTTGTVRGSVSNKDTGVAVENALVSIGSTETYTDTEGIYQLTGIRSGTQTVIASKSGYENYSGTVEAVAGVTVFHDFSMTPNPTTGTVRGRVTNKDTGYGLGDAIVSVSSEKTGTDSRGDYKITGAKAGTRLVISQKTGFENYFSSTEVKAGETVFDDIAMTPIPTTGTVKGIVTDKDTGSPVGDARVSIGSTEVRTDSNGHFDLNGISAGTQQIHAQKTGYESYSASLEVKAGETVFHDITMTPKPTTGTVRGSVTNKDTGDPIENALVSIGSTQTYTDSDGAYQLTGIASGTQTVTASHSGYENYSGSVEAVAGETVFNDFSMTLKPTTGTVMGRVTDKDTGSGLEDAVVYISSKKTQTDSRGDYEITGAKAGTRLEISLKTGFENYFASTEVKAGEIVIDDIAMTPKPATGSVKGIVTDKDTGGPAGNAFVSIGSVETRTDANGQYELVGIGEGTHEIDAQKAGYQNYNSTVNVTAGLTTFHDIQMVPEPTTGTVEGIVTDQTTGSALEGVRMLIGSTEIITKSDGHYRLTGLDEGAHNILAEKSGYNNYSETVTVDAGNVTIHDIHMVPEPKHGAVQGHVTNASTGDPVRGVTIRITGTSTETETDENGFYLITGVLAGTSQIVGREAGFETYEGSVTITAGQT